MSGFADIHAENLLIDAGKKLLPLPSSCPELLVVLAQMEQHLSCVDQSPSESMKDAIHPIGKALIAKKLARHADMDVKILVLCCNCEILRIMAPIFPYNDQKLKEFFKLAIKMFGKLSYDVSTERYTRLTNALKLFRRYKMPMVMLDLELDNLIVRLFRKFLTNAGSNLPDVVNEMEMIMTNIIQECDEPIPEAVHLLLLSVRKNSQFKWKLGENVLKNCGGLIKPCLLDVIREMGIHIQDYSEIVAYICNDVSENEIDPIIPSTSCIISVGGYKVKNSIGPILEEIFMKHGDIAAECVFKTDCVRVSFLELVCEVVTQLQTNDDEIIICKMEEIESKVSEAEAANNNVSWIRSYLEAFLKRKEATEKSSELTEVKGKMGMVKKAAEMEVRERHVELMTAQKRVEKAERWIKVLDLVEKKLDINLLDSKTEQDLWASESML